MCGRIKRRLNILVETADPFCCFVVLLRLIYNSPETGYDRINELYLIQEIASITTGEKGGLHIGNNKNKKINYFNSFFSFRYGGTTQHLERKKKKNFMLYKMQRHVWWWWPTGPCTVPTLRYFRVLVMFVFETLRASSTQKKKRQTESMTYRAFPSVDT